MGARAAGVHLGIDGDDLVLEAASAPPTAVLDALSRHKAEIMALLRPAEDGGRARTGRRISTNMPGSLISMAGRGVRRPKPRPLPAASSNG
jgi:hypothetical protein